MSAPTFPGFRFDGRRAEPTPVVLRVENACLVVETAEGTELEREQLSCVAVSEAFDHAPRLLSFPSGSTLEVPDDSRRFANELRAAGVRPTFTVRLQNSVPGVVVVVVALVGLLTVGYFKGLPVAARWLAFALPPRLEARMGDQLLAMLDKHRFKPSRLHGVLGTGVADRFARAAAAIAPGVPYRLEFRTTAETRININAMALPGGVIILLDGLLAFAGDEDAVLGVLGHELGHVVHKHSMRQLLQSAGAGTVASLLWGDFSGVASNLPVALGVLRYSREFEREADEFAIQFLHAQDVPVRPLYQFLARLRALESQHRDVDIPDFISTHPSTDERLERLRREIR